MIDKGLSMVDTEKRIKELISKITNFLEDRPYLFFKPEVSHGSDDKILRVFLAFDFSERTRRCYSCDTSICVVRQEDLDVVAKRILKSLFYDIIEDDLRLIDLSDDHIWQNKHCYS